jgi:hypothetical protein
MVLRYVKVIFSDFFPCNQYAEIFLKKARLISNLPIMKA